jgi:hypothetical protein
MLISHRHGYLFVHIAKTGGTSVRSALRVGNWRDPLAWSGWFAHRLSAWSGHRIGARIPRHAPVIVAREMLPPAVYFNLFKFAFVRNPWDRVVSAYAHFQRERTEILRRQRIDSFESFVRFVLETPAHASERPALIRAIQRPQLESLVGFHGELLVDFVGRYENLASDFDQVLQRISMTATNLPHKRRGQRDRDYRSLYTDALAESVGQHYADDLTAFQYTFDDCDELTSRGNGAAWSNTKAIAGRVTPAVCDDLTEGAAEC